MNEITPELSDDGFVTIYNKQSKALFIWRGSLSGILIAVVVSIWHFGVDIRDATKMNTYVISEQKNSIDIVNSNNKLVWEKLNDLEARMRVAESRLNLSDKGK